MNWMDALVRTYDSVSPRIDEFLDKTPMDNPPLLPLCVTTQKAHIEIMLDQAGTFIDAKVLSDDYSVTIVPCTEDSSGRTASISPHPLHDKLQYVAGDYVKYGGSKKHGYENYLKSISEWCRSDDAHNRVKIIEKYVKCGTVIKDLVDHGVLFLNSSERLATKEDFPDAEIFKYVDAQEDSFIRWEINDGPPRFSKDKNVWKSWKKYYLNTMTNRGISSITGTETIIASNHPAKIRKSSDMAKIISSNDETGFTYRGRFERAEQVCAVGYEESQKAHNALKWLIGCPEHRYRNEGLVVVSWTIFNENIPEFMSDISEHYAEDLFSYDIHESIAGFTGKEDAKIFRNMLRGYYREFDPKDDVFVLALNSATPGRLSILLFRELSRSEYLERIVAWNEKYSWLHKYKSKTINGKKQDFFIGAPTPKDIAEIALGKKTDQKAINDMTERLLPCIIDGIPIPLDIVDLSIRQASNPPSIKESEEWEKTLSIACSLFKGTTRREEKEGYKMSLDEKRETRDYLYGRLLAVADKIESDALKKAKESRPTTALRYMQRFRDRPYSTWIDIELSLNPYLMRLDEGLRVYFLRIISGIMDMFDYSDFTKDKQLSGEFLLGFHSQREWFYMKKTEDEKEEQ